MQLSHVIQVGQVSLVFGLDWIPLLGDEGRAADVAGRHGASHLALSGNPPAALGMAMDLSRRSAYWSAALLMASQYPIGTVVRVIPLEEGAWHVLACHEGVALVRADRSYPDHALACQAVEVLRMSYPHLSLHEDPPPGGEEDGRTAGLQDLAKLSASVPPLQRVRRRAVRWVVLVLLALAAALFVAGFWRGSSPPASLPLTAHAAWTLALDQTLARQPVHGPAGTRDLLQALYRQPVHLAGWRMQSLRCEPGSESPHWRCVGDYRRDHAAADNRGLLAAAPADWQLDFPSIDRARTRWALTPAAMPVQLDKLSANGMLARDWVSALQGILPAFSKIQVEPPRALAIPVPRDTQGRELPRPADLPALATRALQVQGPLQSASLLVPLAQAVSWRRVSLTFTPGARTGVRASRLILHLEGNAYEGT
jgi:hypothetical protein